MKRYNMFDRWREELARHPELEVRSVEGILTNGTILGTQPCPPMVPMTFEITFADGTKRLTRKYPDGTVEEWEEKAP